MSVSPATTNFSSAFSGLGTSAAGTGVAVTQGFNGGLSETQIAYYDNGIDSVTLTAAPYNTTDVVMIEAVAGFGGLLFNGYAGTWSGGWPTVASLSPIAVASKLAVVGTGSMGSGAKIGAANITVALFGGNRANAGNPDAVIAVLKNLRVDYHQ